jgi:hypothetical protein
LEEIKSCQEESVKEFCRQPVRVGNLNLNTNDIVDISRRETALITDMSSYSRMGASGGVTIPTKVNDGSSLSSATKDFCLFFKSSNSRATNLPRTYINTKTGKVAKVFQNQTKVYMTRQNKKTWSSGPVL